MEKEKLHRFFAGMASIEEGMAIREWVETSPENKRAFQRERRLFDALMLHGDGVVSGCNVPPSATSGGSPTNVINNS